VATSAKAIITANAVDQSIFKTAVEIAGKAAGMRDKATDVAEKAASCLTESLQPVSHDVFPLDQDLSKTNGIDTYEEFYGYNTQEPVPNAPGQLIIEPSRRSNMGGVYLPDQDLTLKDADSMEAEADEISVDVETEAEKSWGLLHRVKELFPALAQNAGDGEMEAQAVERELQRVRREESKRTGEITALLARGWMSPESVRRLKEELREMQAKTVSIRESAGSSSSMFYSSMFAGGSVPNSPPAKLPPVSRAQSWHGAVEFGPSVGFCMPPRLAATPEVPETSVDDPLSPILPASAQDTTSQEPSASAESPPLAEEQKAVAEEPAPADEVPQQPNQQENQQQDAPTAASAAESETPPAAAPNKGKGKGQGKGKAKGGKGPPAPPPKGESQPEATAGCSSAEAEATHGEADSASDCSAPEVEEPKSPPPIKAEAKAAPPVTKDKGKGAKGDANGAKGGGKGKAGGKGGPAPKAGAKAKATAKAALPKGKPIGRRFDWKMLTSDKVEGTVFANLSAKMQKVSVDVTRLRSLFEMPKEQASKAKSSAAPPKPTQVEVLAHSRAQNVMIAIRKQPLIPEVVKALEELDFEADALTPEAIEILIGAVPTAEEAKAIVGQKPEVLRGVERQILPLARMERPVAGQRLRVMLFNKMMKELSKDAHSGLGILHGALEDAQNSPAFRTVLCHTIRLGSIINFGNTPKPETGEVSGDTEQATAPVAGFSLDALSKLALFRAPGNARITLLHVLVAQLSVEDASLHARLQDEMGKVHKAAKRSLASLSEDVGAFSREAEFFTNSAASLGGASSSEPVVAKLVRFSEQATAEAAALVQLLADARAISKATLAFFAMQARPAEVDAKALELCILLSEFLVAFEKARREITQRPDLAVMCHSGTAEVFGKSEQDSPVPRTPRSSKSRPIFAARVLTAAASAKAGNETSTEVPPTDELAAAASTAGESHSTEAASPACASATVAAGPAADAVPADVSATTATCTAGEVQSVQATVEDPSDDASAVAVSSVAADFSEEAQSAKASVAGPAAMEAPPAAQDSPRSLPKTNSFMVLITDEVEAAAAVEVEAAAAANALDSTANTSPRAMQRTDSFMALITDEVEAAAAANAVDTRANTA